MNWRWMIVDHVPPEITLTPLQRRQLTVRLKRMPNPTSLKNELLGFALTAPILIIWLGVQHWIVTLTDDALGTYGFLVQQFIFWFVIWLVLAAAMHLFRRKHVWLVLREMGYELCPHCGYWLHALPPQTQVCPECGKAREPMPLQASPKESS